MESTFISNKILKNNKSHNFFYNTLIVFLLDLGKWFLENWLVDLWTNVYKSNISKTEKVISNSNVVLLIIYSCIYYKHLNYRQNTRKLNKIII